MTPEDMLIAKLAAFMMVLTRVAAFFLASPIFSSDTIPARVKAAIVVLLAIFFAMVNPSIMPARHVNTLEAALLVANEAVYGLAMGLVAVSLFMAVRIAGQIIDREMGLAMAEILDPLTQEPSQAMAALLEIVFVLFFLSANGHHILLQVMAQSYQTFPAGSTPSISTMAAGVAQAGGYMLLAGLRLAAPVLAAFVLIIVVLAMLARVVPEMDILFTSLPLRVATGLVMLAFFLPLTFSYLSELTGWIDRLLPI
jgi:flagellar biosynthetic protein FliR